MIVLTLCSFILCGYVTALKFFNYTPDESYKVVSIYEFHLEGISPPPTKFTVKILYSADNGYTCRVSHFVHRSGLMGAHRVSFGTHDSEYEALSEAFSHGLMNYDVNDEGAKWEVCDWF